MRLFTRVFLILMLSALLPALATGIWFLRSNARVQDNARQLHEQLAAISVDLIEAAVLRLNRSLGFAEDLERAVGKDEGENLKILQRATNTSPEFQLVALMDSTGKEIIRVADSRLFPGEGENLRGDPTFRKAAESGNLTLSPVFETNGIPMIRAIYPLMGTRYLYAVYSLDDLWSKLKRIKIGQTGRILLLDLEDKPLAGFALEGSGAIRREAAAEKSAWLQSIPTESGAMVGAYAKPPSLPWRVLTLQPRSEAFAVSDRFQLQAFSFLLVIGGIIAFLAYWITGRLTQPLQELISAADRASRSEFDRSVPKLGVAELNHLAGAINEMMHQLKAYQDLQVERIVTEKARVEALVHTIPDGIVLAGFDAAIAYMNASARYILGARDKSTVPKGSTLHEILREPKLREMVLPILRRHSASGQVEVELQGGGDGRGGVFLCRAVTVSSNKKELGILLLLRDITAERELDRMKDEFFHSLVHDLRNPLGTIDGFIEIMKSRSNLGDQEKMYMGYVQASCERLRQLVTDILDTAKIESGSISLKREPVKPGDVLARMKAVFPLQAETRGIQMLFEDKAIGSQAADCDRALIERVVMNLLGNALKFTPKGGKITLAAVASGKEMEFSVTDTGPGIPADKLDFVFEKFKQLNGPHQRSGYGLGLSICKKIVELHGGRIWVESEEGRGSRFIFRVPQAQAAASSSAASS